MKAVLDSAIIATILSHLSDRFGHLVAFSVWLLNKSDQLLMAKVIVVQETTLNKSEGISPWLIATPSIPTFGSILICEKDSSGADNTYYWFALLYSVHRLRHKHQLVWSLFDDSCFGWCAWRNPGHWGLKPKSVSFIIDKERQCCWCRLKHLLIFSDIYSLIGTYS